MTIEQIYTECLAQGSYYMVSNGEAIIIDPLRDTKAYLQRLKKDNSKLKYIFETHFHADFVSGHLDLSEATGAPIVFGPNANPSFDAIIAEDNQLFKIGNSTIKLLHTPGHTLESSSFLLFDENDKEVALFSGDTLFLGDVGRPDLAQKKEGITQYDLASLLYDSLYHKILPLPDEILVYPAHGAGSACGKNMQKETFDTLGNQKLTNYALNQPNKESFVKAVTDGLLPPPKYFEMNVLMNKKGYENSEKVISNGLKKLALDDFEKIVNFSEVLLLDTRSNEDFAQAFIPKSINIGLNGDFAPWLGTLIENVNQPIVIISNIGDEVEVVTRLSRVGFDVVLGYLEGGFDTWKNAGKNIEFIDRISAQKFEDVLENDTKIIDVRKEIEFTAEHVENAINKPLAFINTWISGLDTTKHFYLYCAGGYRSMMAASILYAKGYRNFTEIIGGFSSIMKTNIPKTNFVCASKIK